MTQISKIREGKWTCSYCNTTVRGSIRTCPNCGKPRSDGVKFFEDKNNSYLNEEQAKNINKNPDWICPYCNSLNSDSSHDCKSCGASKTESNKNYFNSKQNETKKDESNEYNKNKKILDLSKENTSYSIKNKYIKNTLNVFLFMLISFLLVVLPIITLNQTKKLQINNFGWEREIVIDKYVPVNESDWFLPSGATLLYANSELHHTDRVESGTEIKTRTVSKLVDDGVEQYKVGTKDLGNGYFEDIYDTRTKYKTEYVSETYSETIYENVPVYRMKYYYSIYRWIYSRTESTTANDKKPYWKELKLADNEKELSRNEKFYLLCTNLKKNKDVKYYIDASLWNQLNKGDVIKVKTTLSKITKIITN